MLLGSSTVYSINLFTYDYLITSFMAIIDCFCRIYGLQIVVGPGEPIHDDLGESLIFPYTSLRNECAGSLLLPHLVSRMAAGSHDESHSVDVIYRLTLLPPSS